MQSMNPVSRRVLYNTGCWDFTTVSVTMSEWPGSALTQSPKGDIEPNHPSEINPNSDSRSRNDGCSRRFVQYRVDQSTFPILYGIRIVCTRTLGQVRVF